MTKTLFSLLAVFCFCNFLTAQDVNAVNQWAGKSNDETHAKAGPENGMITNQDDFAELWEKWHEGEDVPEIDFSKHMVLVATVGGPNRMMIPNQMRIVDGNLSFQCAATRMGGPGFGHAMVQIPCEGITSVNGVAVPAAGGGEMEDSVHVTMIGTIETGIMAIGGETTGTMMTSGNITWELEVPAALREKVEALNGKKAKVKGKLEKRAGVEIRERWIVNVESVADPAAKDEAGDDAGDDASFSSIEIMQSGGFAGVAINFLLEADGSLTVMNRGRKTESNLAADKLKSVHQLIAKTDWASVPASTKAPNVADDFHFEVMIDTGKRTYQFDIAGTKLDEVKALGELVRMMQ